MGLLGLGAFNWKIKEAEELKEASFTYRSQKEDRVVGTVGGK